MSEIEPTHIQIRKALGLVTDQETADTLDVEVSTLATWRGLRKGPPTVKLGKQVFYTVAGLNAWIQSEAQRQASESLAA